MTTAFTARSQGEDALRNLINDDVAWISELMEIPNKSRVRVPLIPWPVQAKLLRSLSGRDIVIKDAQIGCTSIITAKFMKDVMTTPDTTAVIVSHEEFLTQRLLHRAQVFYDSVPDKLKPAMDHQSSYEKRLPDINSVMYIGTARSQVFGRGEPIHRLLFSEEAFYVRDAYTRIILPALQRVPPDGMVVRESTPNGEDGSFHDEVQAAVAGESAFKLHTLWWWENPDNSLRSTSDIAETLGLNNPDYNEEERALVATHNLRMDQIRWRRWKIMEVGAMFFQEHLESLDTCFLTVGEPHYDPGITLILSKKCYPAPHFGPEGSRVWFEPEPEGVYVMGIDPGQGKQSQSVAQVWRFDLDHPRHEATLAGYHEPEPMARKCIALGNYYGTPLAVPEANSHGIGLIEHMRKSYPRIYYRRDPLRGTTTLQHGYLTTAKTKPYIMQELVAQLPHIETYDAELVRQIRGFRDIGMGKVDTISADDFHDAACLALIGGMGTSAGASRGYQGSTGWKW